MTNLLLLSAAPTLIILFYIYIKDKYKKEPIYFLLTGTFYGILISFPISLTGYFIEAAAGEALSENVFFLSFITASLTEESFKYIILLFLCLNSKHYDEYFDGIVYGVFISLGFAGFENILYVLSPTLGGIKTAFLRAFLSVPAHGFFGVSMGHYLSSAKFRHERKAYFLAFLIPFINHGLYDFILMSDFDVYYIVFILFIAYLWFDGFKKINKDIQTYPYY